ncbi:Predicted arabinose efflux permease, MFS family [Actinomadura meyerae]|uniref:Predicted arabinose efflux permease, MFS family n=1 Tax=Actinomadura meyerae TaxID=240840 RepID=A0A239NP35_9ACTN|nr:MFS transporter [Actinomadura meyerae]SNT56605.1 Predicted arabinose efflux permease, MFS family [Actinomadura meyerae]
MSAQEEEQAPQESAVATKSGGRTERVPEREPSIFRDPGYRWLFSAALVSKIGAQVSYIAIPLIAVTELNATAGQVGLLGALSFAAFLLVGLPAGVWVDRMRRRPVMIVAQVSRAVLMATVPIAWVLDSLTIYQLYAVVLLSGVGTVFDDVAAQSYLPHVAGRDRLMAANTGISSLNAGSEVAGRSVGGYLVAAVTAAGAVMVDIAGFLLSALMLMRIRRPEAKSERGTDRDLPREMRDGLRFVLGHPILRPIAFAGALTNFSFQVNLVIMPIIFVRQLHLSETALGAYLSIGGVGVLTGALLARRVAHRVGHGRMLWIAGAAVAPIALFVPLIDNGPWLFVAGGAWLLVTMKAGIDNVVQVSFRQRATPDAMLGRMNATMRFLMTGALAIGAGVGGLVAQLAGARAALWVSAAGLACIWVIIYFSPLRGMRDLPGES